MRIHQMTPWGAAQTVRNLAPGVVHVTTASHGGFLVTDEVLAKWPVGLRELEPFAGHGAYEEDCDWSIVALAMPELFPDPGDRAFAVNTLLIFHKDVPGIMAYLKSGNTLPYHPPRIRTGQPGVRPEADSAA